MKYPILVVAVFLLVITTVFSCMPPVGPVPTPAPTTSSSGPSTRLGAVDAVCAVIKLVDMPLPREASAPKDVLQPAAAMSPAPATRIVRLDRADQSGIFVLPVGVTVAQVITFYQDGKPVPRDRWARTHAADEVDVFDARLESVITARILQ